MIERADVLNLFKETDRAAVEGRADLDRLAAVLPAYEGGAAAGWFERFRLNVDPTFGDGLPESIDESLARLAELGQEDPADPLRSKMLLAIAALVRADPESNLPGQGEGGRIRALGSNLTFVMPADNNGEEQQDALLELLATEMPSTDVLSEWELVLAEAVNSNLLLAEVAAEANQCCQDSWTEVRVDGRQWPAAILTTSFSTTLITVAGLGRYLDPVNWPACCTLWCVMNPIYAGPSSTCYFEQISYDCAAWRLSTCLEFVRRDIEGGVTLEYQLCPHPEHLGQADRIVTVDEGSITAWQDGPQLRVTSTKRVSFRGNFDAPSFAMWSCALGYGEAAKDMALKCAARDPDPPADDPLRQPPMKPPWNDPAELLGNLIEHAAHVAADELRACAAAAQTSMAKAATGMYTVDDMISDVAQMWVRGARCMFQFGGGKGPSQGNQPWTDRSREFTDPSPDPILRRTVALDGPLVSGFGYTIPLRALGTDPPVLDPHERIFRVTANIANQHAGTYTGRANIVPSGGGPQTMVITTVPVWIQVG